MYFKLSRSVCVCLFPALIFADPHVNDEGKKRQRIVNFLVAGSEGNVYNAADTEYEIDVADDTDPWTVAEEFCAIAGLQDPFCAKATEEIVKKHHDLHGLGPNEHPQSSCEWAQASFVVDNSTRGTDLSLDRGCPVGSWIQSAREWAAQSLSLPKDYGTEVDTPLKPASFNPHSPYDGRMAWVADPSHPVFSPPAVTTHDASQPPRIITPENTELASLVNPSPPATLMVEAVGPLLADLADVALAPWMSSRSSVVPTQPFSEEGEECYGPTAATGTCTEKDKGKERQGEDTERSCEEMTPGRKGSAAAAAAAAGAGAGITREDVNEALRTDPAVCFRVTLGSRGKWWISRPCTPPPRRLRRRTPSWKGREEEVEGRGRHVPQEPDDEEAKHDEAAVEEGGEEEDADEEGGLVAPVGHHEEPWWRVRRRQSALEALLDGARLLELKGRPLKPGTQLVLCVGDGVPTAQPLESAARAEPSSSSSSAKSPRSTRRVPPWRYPTQHARKDGRPTPAFSLVACAGSESIPFPVYMNRSNHDDSYANWDAFVRHFRDLPEMKVPWRDKVPKVVWRGNTLGKSCWDGTPNATLAQQVRQPQSPPAAGWCGRRRLRMEAAKRATRHLFDVAYDYRPMSQQLGYQAALYAEGHCGWADRGRHLLLAASRQALLWQETMCREWYSLLLRPWVHYVPVDYHFTTLVGAAAWVLCPDNAPTVEAMLANAKTFADGFLAQNAAATYASLLLERYAQAQEGAFFEPEAASMWEDRRVMEEEWTERPTGEEDGRALDDGCPREEVRGYLQRTRPFGEYFHLT